VDVLLYPKLTSLKTSLGIDVPFYPKLTSLKTSLGVDVLLYPKVLLVLPVDVLLYPMILPSLGVDVLVYLMHRHQRVAAGDAMSAAHWARVESFRQALYGEAKEYCSECHEEWIHIQLNRDAVCH
jgi:hypothetical protein